MPTRTTLARLALHTLEDVLTEVEVYCLPSARTWGQRLALAWLAHEGIAEEWQCHEFWKTAVDPMPWGERVPHLPSRSGGP